jgi:penicillin-insensitive murein endopeptidase
MALEPQGPGFEVLRRARRRFFGHPALVDYVRRLAAEARRAGLPALLVGDLAQPRGGPAPSGHGSHQSGLDVDLAYTRPPDSLWSPLDPERRETLEFPAVVDPVRGTPTELWHPRILRLLELAASDPVVDRIFVHPTVKREACAAAAGAPWVSRLRPWWGHHDHFHVRLRCPAESPRCIGQPPVPLGDGCGADLAWWFGEEARRRPLRARRPSASLPGICRSILGD